MMIEPEEEKEDEDGRSLYRFYDYVNKKVETNTKIPEEVDHAIC